MPKLQPLENTVVHLRTQAEYEEYMQLAEEAGWSWIGGQKPTDFNAWRDDRENTCVSVKDTMTYRSLMVAKFNSFTILTLPELKAKFGIGTKPKTSTWEPHYTKDGHTLSRDEIKLADGTTYTPAQLRERLNLLRSIEKAYRQKFPSSK